MKEEKKPFRVPKTISRMLLQGEHVVALVKQSRLKALFTPDSIIVTNQRIIRYSPSAMGLRGDIEDYRYEDIANLKISKGIMLASITLKRRFMSEDLVLDNLANGRAEYVSKVVQENIRRLNSPATSSVSASEQISPSSPVDPLQVLKLRFATGEITKEEFEEMKRTLG